MSDHTGRVLSEERSSKRRVEIGWAWLVTIFLVALLHRGLCFALLHEHPLFAHPVVDGALHDAWARRIAAGDWLGQGPDDVFKPPLYPYWLAAIYALLGRQVQIVQWLQLLLGALSCVLVAVLGGRLLGRGAGILAGLISALYAPYVFFELQLLTPALSIFLNLIAVLLLTARVGKGGRFACDFGAGAVLGLSAGVRPDVIVPAALVILHQVIRGPRVSWRGPLGRIFCIAIAFVGVVLPIILRNYHLTNSLIPISSNAGINFYVGNATSSNGTKAVPVGLYWERLLCQVPQRVLERPASATRWWLSQSWQRMRSEPGTSLARLGKKCAAFMNRREFRNNICYHFAQMSCWPMRAPFVQYGLILPLAVCGLVALWREGSSERRDVVAMCGLWVVGYLILGVVFFVTARFRLPAIPFLTIPAAWAVIRILSGARHRQWKALSGYGVGILAVGIIAWPTWFGAPRAEWTRDYVNLGNSLRAAGKPRDAEEAYRQALAIRRDDPDANYLLAHLLLPNTPARALEHLETARRLVPDSPDLMLAVARAHLALQDTAQATRTLQELVRLSETCNLWPKRTEWAIAHTMLAELDPSRAETHWRQAWSIDPRAAAEASFVRRRELDRVLEVFRAEAVEKTWDWYSQANYGIALLELDQPDEAAETLRRAVRLAPEHHILEFHLARALLGAGREAEAVAVLDELSQTLADGPLRDQVRELRRQSGTRRGWQGIGKKGH